MSALRSFAFVADAYRPGDQLLAMTTAVPTCVSLVS